MQDTIDIGGNQRGQQDQKECWIHTFIAAIILCGIVYLCVLAVWNLNAAIPDRWDAKSQSAPPSPYSIGDIVKYVPTPNEAKIAKAYGINPEKTGVIERIKANYYWRWFIWEEKQTSKFEYWICWDRNSEGGWHLDSQFRRAQQIEEVEQK